MPLGASLHGIVVLNQTSQHIFVRHSQQKPACILEPGTSLDVNKQFGICPSKITVATARSSWICDNLEKNHIILCSQDLLNPINVDILIDLE
jgi:hypothetical protein